MSTKARVLNIIKFSALATHLFWIFPHSAPFFLSKKSHALSTLKVIQWQLVSWAVCLNNKTLSQFLRRQPTRRRMHEWEKLWSLRSKFSHISFSCLTTLIFFSLNCDEHKTVYSASSFPFAKEFPLKFSQSHQKKKKLQKMFNFKKRKKLLIKEISCLRFVITCMSS